MRSLFVSTAVLGAVAIAVGPPPAPASAWDVGGWSSETIRIEASPGQLLALGVDRRGQALLLSGSERSISISPFVVPVTPTMVHPHGGAWAPGPAEAAAPRLVRMNADGQLLAVEVTGGFDAPLAVRVRRGRDGRWDAAEELVSRPAGSSRRLLPVDAALSDRGEALVVAAIGGELLAAGAPPGGGWGEPTTVDAGPGARSIRVAMTEAGDALVVWSRPSQSGGLETVSRRRTPDGRWLAIRRLGTGPRLVEARIALAEDGRALAAWSASAGVGVAASEPGNGLWRRKRLFASIERTGLAGLGVDGAGRGLALVVRGGELLRASFLPRSGWRASGRVPGAAGRPASRARLAVGPLGDAMVVWDAFGTDPASGLARAWTARRDPSGRWEARQAVGAALEQGFLFGPLAAVNAAGDAAVAWGAHMSNSAADGEVASSPGRVPPALLNAAAEPAGDALPRDLRLRLMLSRPGPLLLTVHRAGEARALAGAIVPASRRRVAMALPAALQARIRAGGMFEVRVASGHRAGGPAAERRVTVAVRAAAPGRVRLTARQLLINQRIAQAAIRRVAALEARLDGRPAPAWPAAGSGRFVTLTVRQLRINQRIGQAAIRRVAALEARFEGRPAPSRSPKRTEAAGFTLSAAQLRINQRIGQAAVHRVNALAERIEAAGTVATSGG